MCKLILFFTTLIILLKKIVIYHIDYLTKKIDNMFNIFERPDRRKYDEKYYVFTYIYTLRINNV